MPTSHDVARVAGVSQSTVSRVLLGSDKVSPATRERVLAALKTLDYAPNGMARAIRIRRTNTIGAVLSDLTKPFQPELLNAISAAARAAGQRVVFWRADANGEESLTALRERSVDGLIFTTVPPDSTALGALLAGGAPVVLLHRGLEGIPCDQVVSDNRDGGRRIATYLVANGRRRIALIASDAQVIIKSERAQGFREALLELGSALPRRRQASCADDYHEAQRVTAALLTQTPPPDAIFCTGDTIAFGAIDAVRAAGLRVGHDVWVVGYNDTAVAGWGAFDLTTVRQDTAAMAERAVDLLLSRVRGEDRECEQVVLPIEVVVRGSTGNIPYAHQDCETPYASS